MDDEVINKLFKFFTKYNIKKFNKGDILIRAYENPKAIYFMEEGSVKMYFISKNGDEVILNIFKPYAFFPMSWAINSTPNNYYWEAMTDIQVRIAPKDEVIKFIKENSDIMFNLLSRVYIGTDGILEKMTYLMSGDALSRLITEIIIHSKRFGEKNGNEIKLKVSENDLASETGLTRETVSRQLNLLKKKGLITFSNKTLIIKNINEFRNEIV